MTQAKRRVVPGATLVRTELEQLRRMIKVERILVDAFNKIATGEHSDEAPDIAREALARAYPGDGGAE